MIRPGAFRETSWLCSYQHMGGIYHACF